MAGAGYKLFNTGDVLTAAQVNTYLMQQTVMVFASSAARTSALSGVLAEGMVSYLQDTNTLEVYDGSAWVGATGDITGLTAGTGISISSATGPVPTITSDVATTFDAKGDLVVGTGADTFAKLTVGNSGDTIVADSSATTGLRWQGNFAAGKNAIINGDFRINQRAFSSTAATASTYGFDRWATESSGGTATWSAQTFTPGTAPVAGYEGVNYLRCVISGQSAAGDYAAVVQKIEDVRTFAGQTVTVSFWAKASTGTPKLSAELRQQFGSGGSADALATPAQNSTISTSWARYSQTFSVPSISGKTIGTGSSLTLIFFVSAGSNLNSRTNSSGINNATIELWGFQIEAGNTATAFQTATGTLAGELAACQRYLPAVNTTSSGEIGTGMCNGTTSALINIAFHVPARVAPTGITASAASNFTLRASSGGGAGTPTTIAFNSASPVLGQIQVSGSSGLTQGNATSCLLNGQLLFTGCEL